MKTTTKKRIALTSFGIIIFLLSSAFVHPPRWEYLGLRKVNKSFDRDEIAVTGIEGSFNALKLQVKYRAITMYDMKVHYRNGSVEDIKLRVHIPAGGESRVIDLRGGNRVITKVVFRYETKADRGKRAELRLFGRH
jgi:hypothetical protein